MSLKFQSSSCNRLQNTRRRFKGLHGIIVQNRQLQLEHVPEQYSWLRWRLRHSASNAMHTRPPPLRQLQSRVPMTTESCKNGETTLFRINFWRYVGRVTICSWMLTSACCLAARLCLSSWLALVSSWSMVTHTYSYYFLLSLALSPIASEWVSKWGDSG